MESEIKERTLHRRRIIGELNNILKGGLVNTEIKNKPRDSMLLPTDMYRCDYVKHD